MLASIMPGTPRKPMRCSARSIAPCAGCSKAMCTIGQARRSSPPRLLPSELIKLDDRTYVEASSSQCGADRLSLPRGFLRESTWRCGLRFQQNRLGHYIGGSLLLEQFFNIQTRVADVQTHLLLGRDWIATDECCNDLLVLAQRLHGATRLGARFIT